MTKKFAQGKYQVLNPDKYVGNHTPQYRSSWEHAFMRFCDSNDNILQWASEAIAIPYRNPLTGKMSRYVPDFFVSYRDKNNKIKAEIIEIKPKKQSMMTERMSTRDRAAVAVNMAKWDQATKWCRKNSMTFRVVTEQEIFHQGTR